MTSRCIPYGRVFSPGLIVVWFAGCLVSGAGLCVLVQDGPGGASVPPDKKASEDEYKTDMAALRGAEDEIRAREERIEKEVKALGASELPTDHWARQWAGTYYVGDGLGMNVMIKVAPRTGITYTWHGCLGLYDGNYGEVVGTLDPDRDDHVDGLKIKWTLHPRHGFDFDSENYYFVRWDGSEGSDGRRYFVPESKMIELVNNFNEGGFSRDALYSAPRKMNPDRDDAGWHENGPAIEGVPQLPARWAGLIARTALDAKIVSLAPVVTRNVTGNVDSHRMRISLDKGGADGVYVGLELSVGELMTGAGFLTIDKVEEHQAEGEYVSFFESGKPPQQPSAGMVVHVFAGLGQSEDADR